METTLPPHLPPHVRAALAEAKARLSEMYGDRLARVVLYGSYARGDAREDSDVDLLVVLRGDYEPYAEIKRTSALHLDLLLRYGVDLAIQPFDEHEVTDLERPFMRNVAADAVEL